jgi:hypothetical protein
MRSRTWPWLKTRIAGLLNTPKAIAPDGTPVPTTRIGWQLDPPKPKPTKS